MQCSRVRTVSSVARVLFVTIDAIYSVVVNRTARKHGGFVALSNLKASGLLLFTDQAYVQQTRPDQLTDTTKSQYVLIASA